jgi:hypothetical protein
MSATQVTATIDARGCGGVRTEPLGWGTDRHAITISTSRADRAVIRDAVTIHGCAADSPIHGIIAVMERAGAIAHPDTGACVIRLSRYHAAALRDTLADLIADPAETAGRVPSVAWITASGIVDQIDAGDWD